MRAIAAMSNNRVIGKGGRMPWKCKDDLSFFRKMTTGKNLIMGNTTFKDVGPLSDRFTYVLTKDTEKYKLSTDRWRYKYGNLDKVISDDVWVCGGESIYKLLLPRCSDLYLTIILEDYEGDTYMPEFDHLFPEQRVIVEKKDLWIVHYWKKTTPTEEARLEGFDGAWMGKQRSDNPYNYDGEYLAWYAWYEGWVEGMCKKNNMNSNCSCCHK